MAVLNKRHSLTNVGGPATQWGDAAESKKLAELLAVEPAEQLPFTHGFHAYPARMHPEIARRALEAWPGKSVIDPFMGSGTVAVETLRTGRAFIGIDVSRIAVEVAWTRTRLLDPKSIQAIDDEGQRIGRAGKQRRQIILPAWAKKDITWYPKYTLFEIVTVQGLIAEQKDPVLRRILRCILSSLIVKLSRQKSDSVTLADPEFQPWPPGSTYRFFKDKCFEVAGNIESLVNDLRRRGIKPAEPDLRLADARVAKLRPTSTDLVLTSPPYPGTYDYAFHHVRRNPIFDDTGDLIAKAEIGARRNVHDEPTGRAQYLGDLEACLKNLAPAMAPGGRMVWLIGDGIAGGQVLEVDLALRQIAPRAGLSVTAIASQNRREWTYGREGNIKREHIVLMRAP